MPLVSPFTDKQPAMKRLVVCCDGTWQDSDGGAADVPTNVTRIARALRSVTSDDVPISQVMYYQSGVGTGGEINRLLGGGTGLGLSEHVREGYGFLAHNYHPGDTIHLFGFSRGAYTARSIAGLLCRIGLLTKVGMDSFFQIYKDHTEFKFRDPKAVEELHAREGGSLVIPNVKIRTIGCWDTVGSLGIPSLGTPIIGKWIARREQEKYGFHDTNLSHCVENAFHALALDEQRGPFTPTMWTKPASATTNLKQVWFPGVHTNIGGGYEDQEIADMTLAWMIQQMEPFLEFSEDYINRIIRNSETTSKGEWATGKIYNSATGLMRFASGSIRSPAGYGADTLEAMHASVRVRKELMPEWDCGALKGWAWNKETNVWEKGELRMGEDKLGETEKKLAGKLARRDMIRDGQAT